MKTYGGGLTVPIAEMSSLWQAVGSTYATIAQGDAFMAGQLDSSVWDAATRVTKHKSLVMATRAISRLNFSGCKVDEDQSLEFPRGDDTDIPVEIIEACVLIANAYLDGYNLDHEIQNQQLTSQTYASVSATYDRSTTMAYQAAGIPSYDAWLLLLPFLRDLRVFDMYRKS